MVFKACPGIDQSLTQAIMAEHLPRYDCTQSYRWNYEHPPEPVMREIPTVPGTWQFCGHDVASPLGISAGPLLNGRWCLYYAHLGFDVLTYKTVRSSQRACFPLPNLQPVECGQLNGTEKRVQPCDTMHGSWAVAFGMPSSEPEQWRRDIEWTRQHLPTGKILSVSVVGTMQPDWEIDDLAADYARCARWAVESGADCIETNFSCPNVNTCDGQLYLDHQQSEIVSKVVKASIGKVPLMIKIGHLVDTNLMSSLIGSIDQYADAVAMTNSIATTVGISDTTLMFDQQQRGICGRAILDASITQVRQFSTLIQERNSKLQIIGVGGVETASDVTRYLNAGASGCQLATAAMISPDCGLKIRTEMGGIDIADQSS